MYIFDHTMSLSDAAIYSLVAILLVFLVLLILIGMTSLIFKLIRMFEAKDGKVFDEKTKKYIKKDEATTSAPAKVELNDEDMTVAVLVASIDYRNEVKKDVRLVSVKEIK